MGNNVKQGGKVSPLLFNIYMNNVSVQLHTKPIGCSLGTTVVNHLIYFCSHLLVRDCKRYMTVVTYMVVNTMFNLTPPNI